MPDSLRWQKRFFVFSISQRVVYYFKNVDEVHKPGGLRGQIAMSGGQTCGVDGLGGGGGASAIGVIGQVGGF